MVIGREVYGLRVLEALWSLGVVGLGLGALQKRLS